MAKVRALKRSDIEGFPITEATACVAEIVGQYSAIHPGKVDHIDRCWWRIVKRVFYEDREGKETMRRSRTPGKRARAPQFDSMSLTEAMAEGERAVNNWIRGVGWEDQVDAEAKRGAELAWKRLVLRCNYEDAESRKRLAEAEKRNGPRT